MLFVAVVTVDTSGFPRSGWQNVWISAKWAAA
jgi:hypothetical protein